MKSEGLSKYQKSHTIETSTQLLILLVNLFQLMDSVNILTSTPIQLNQRPLCNLPYGFGSRILKIFGNKTHENQNRFLFQLPENLEASEYIQNAELQYGER